MTSLHFKGGPPLFPYPRQQRCATMQPMKMDITREFIERVPKSDLHVHLDGSLRIATLIDLAKAQNIELPSYEEEGIKELVFKDKYANLGEYLQGFAYTCAVLNNVENLQRTAFELAEDNLAEGVRYLEVRFAPQLHLNGELSMKEICQAVADGLQMAADHHNALPAVETGHDIPFRFGIITCAMRTFNHHMGRYYSDLMDILPGMEKREIVSIASREMAQSAVRLRERDGLPIVGFDLAGEEAGYPASYHTEAYQYAHRNFMKKTVHAGEAYGPESIFQAITECHANRIGHGTFLFSTEMIQDQAIENPQRFVEALADYIASRRITMEVCLTSNLQTTPTITSVENHPLATMLDYNLSVSICTDNRLVSGTTVTDELSLVADHLAISRSQFKNIIVAGFKGSFFPGSYNEKRAYVHQLLHRYDCLEKELLAPACSLDEDEALNAD